MEIVSAFDRLALSLIGRPISHIWRGHGSAIFLEIGDLAPSTTRRRDGSTVHNQRGNLSLGVEWSWRIEDARSIICGSWSEEALWPLGFDRLLNGRIQACRLFGALPEIEVLTDAGVRFLSFSTTDGQPRWFLVGRRGETARSFHVEDGNLQFKSVA